MSLEEARLFVTRFVSGGYDPSEYAAFLEWLERAPIDELSVIADEHEALFDLWNLPASGPSAKWVAQLEQKLDKSEAQARKASVKRMDTNRFKRRVWVAAASVIVLVASGAFWLYNREGGQKEAANKKSIEVLYHTVTTSKGQQQQQIVLPDGSKVWLNAASSLKYAVAFNTTRTVELSGEAYFEVVGSAAHPFRVITKTAEVQVLGTRFNVMAYEDEPVSKTTLIEGAVKITSGSEAITLQPGDQAGIGYSSSGVIGPIEVLHGVNKEIVMGWKDGTLEFDNTDLHTVMREIARCYDLDIQYEGNIPAKRFTGSFSRKEDIHQILRILEDQHIHNRINGKTITIMP